MAPKVENGYGGTEQSLLFCPSACALIILPEKQEQKQNKNVCSQLREYASSYQLLYHNRFKSVQSKSHLISNVVNKNGKEGALVGIIYS